MDPIIALAIKGKLFAINCLVEKCWFSVFDKVNGISGFDILVQHAVNSEFKKKKLLKFFEYHATQESVNLIDMFFLSPLIKKMNKNGMPFYRKTKNVLKNLYTIDKSKVTYSILVTNLFSAFSKVPNDAISLIKYMIDKKMLDCTITVTEMCDLMVSSPKVFGWILCHITKTASLSQHYFSTILYYLFITASYDRYLSANLTKYFKVFSINSHLFAEKYANSFRTSVEFAIEQKYLTTDGDFTKFVTLRSLLVFFSDVFGYELCSANVKSLIMKTSDVNTKFFLTSCFSALFFTEQEQTELFEDFLLGLSENNSGQSKSLIDDYFLLFPCIYTKYKNHWDSIVNTDESQNYDVNIETTKTCTDNVDKPHVIDICAGDYYDCNKKCSEYVDNLISNYVGTYTNTNTNTGHNVDNIYNQNHDESWKTYFTQKWDKSYEPESYEYDPVNLENMIVKYDELNENADDCSLSSGSIDLLTPEYSLDDVPDLIFNKGYELESHESKCVNLKNTIAKYNELNGNADDCSLSLGSIDLLTSEDSLDDVPDLIWDTTSDTTM